MKPKTQIRRFAPTGLAKLGETEGLTGTVRGLARHESAGRDFGRFWTRTNRFLRCKPGLLKGLLRPVGNTNNDECCWSQAPVSRRWRYLIRHCSQWGHQHTKKAINRSQQHQQQPKTEKGHTNFCVGFPPEPDFQHLTTANRGQTRQEKGYSHETMKICGFANSLCGKR